LAEGKSLEDYLPMLPKWQIQFEDGHRVSPENFQEYMLNQSYLQEKTSDPTKFEISLFNPPDSAWKAVLPYEHLQPDTFHSFFIEQNGPFSHLLYLHYPNGGIHGLKVF